MPSPYDDFASASLTPPSSILVYVCAWVSLSSLSPSNSLNFMKDRSGYLDNGFLHKKDGISRDTESPRCPLRVGPETKVNYDG